MNVLMDTDFESSAFAPAAGINLAGVAGSNQRMRESKSLALLLILPTQYEWIKIEPILESYWTWCVNHHHTAIIIKHGQ